jgi:hypothetical protein
MKMKCEDKKILTQNKYMAHNVKFSIPERDLGRADVEFKVAHGNSKLGTLKVSKGAIEWVEKDHTIGIKINWKDFDALMRKRNVKE